MSYPYSFGNGALQLFKNGYRVAPLIRGYRYPKNIHGWNDPYLTEEKVVEWSNNYKNAGIVLVTGEVIAIDIDVYEQSKVEEVVAWCLKNIGSSPIRVGKAPKCCLFYKTSEEIHYMRSAVYEDFIGNHNSIEILGIGRSISIYGKYHDPAEKKYYDWHPTADGVLNIPVKELTEVNSDQIKELISFFEVKIPGDWQLKTSQRETCGKPAGNDCANSLEEMAQIMEHQEKLDLPNETWEEILSYLDPNCDRETWYRIGMALSHEFDNSNIGFLLWYNWSCGSPKSDEVTNWDSTWKSFVYKLYKDPATGKIKEPFRGVHLRALAAKSGYIYRIEKDMEIQPSKDKYDAQVYTPPQASLEDFLIRFVFIKKESRVFDLNMAPRYAACSLKDFKNTYAPYKEFIETKEGKLCSYPISKLWLEDYKRLTAMDTVYRPSEGRVIEDEEGNIWVNTFHFPNHKDQTEGEGLNVFFEHMEYLFPYKEEREWFISWIAHKLQKPHIKQKVTPLHISCEQGTGRGWVSEVLEKLVGPWNFSKTTIDQLIGKGNQFHDHVFNKLFVVIDELESGERKKYSVSYKIRSILTDQSQSLNRKYGGFSTEQIYADLSISTNSKNSIALEEFDRRINAMSGPESPRDKAYYDRIYKWLDSCNIGALFHWLKRRDLTDYNWTRSMKTTAREELILNSRSDLEQLFLDYLEFSPLKKKIMTLNEIESQLVATALSQNDPVCVTRDQLRRIVGKYLRRGPQIKVENSRKRYWIVDKNFPDSHDCIREYLLKINQSEKK